MVSRTLPGLWSRLAWAKRKTLSPKYPEQKAGDVAQEVE
jgi:hypothetical protein